jgi:hypothetical protein
MMMSVEKLVELVQPKYSEKTCASVTLSLQIPHHLTRLEHGPPRWETSD